MQTKSLTGRSALITGVSRQNGIGYGIAQRLGAMGTNLFLHSFSPYDREIDVAGEPVTPEGLARDLGDTAVQIEMLEADFLDPQAPANVLHAAVNKFGHVDILVLNHTRDTLMELHDLTADEIDKHLAINVRAALLLVQEYAKQHDGRKGGRVIMLTSGQHLGPMPHPAYVASKGALHQLTATLSDALIDNGITVNTINPGPTKTYQPGEELDKLIRGRMPLGRWGEPDDAARLIAWLVSDDAQWVTGQVINSEGGFRSS